MSSIEVAFFGTLGRDAESKTSKTTGKQYLRLNVRVGDGDGAQWVSVMSFDEAAAAAVDKLVKGARVYVEGGSLKLDEWTCQDGAKRHGLSVMSWHTRLAAIGRNKPQRQRDDGKHPNKSGQPTSDGPGFHDDQIPF